MTAPLTPQIGDSVYLASLFANLHIHGIISDLDTPDQVSASLEVSGGNGLLSLAAIQGPRGAQGTPSPILDLQTQIFDDTEDLPTNLTTDDVDVGKFWIVREFDDDGNAISSKAWVWFGDHYEGFPMGTAGPAGPVPIITFNIELLNPDDDDLENQVVVTGDNYHPSVLLKIKAPRGPEGPATNIADAPDVDMTTPPETGDVLTYNEATNKWEPRQYGTIISKFYTMPENAFHDVAVAIGTRVPLGTFLIPPQEWDCIPVVHGHLRITGVEADSDPFIVGAEVRLGTGGATGGGTLVARGYGNISSYANISPHASGNSSGTAGDAITPDNGRGVIPAGSTGTAATLYVNAFNDGATGLYHFDNRGAQLSITLQPV